jgi:hypothetical protein
MKHTIALLLALLVAVPCAHAQDHDRAIADLLQTEKNFCSQVKTLGFDRACLANMADDCFIPYNLSLTRAEYESRLAAARAKAGLTGLPGPDADSELTWTPSRIEVSEDGTLGYTWGCYTQVTHGKDGKDSVDAGIYLTIWKRKTGGAWKFVYDGAPEMATGPVLKKFVERPDFPKLTGS